jgi:hypothetical protein
LDNEKIKVVKCFLNEFKNAVGIKYGDKYWVEGSPADIIYVAN